jgi:hypothetical protein
MISDSKTWCTWNVSSGEDEEDHNGSSYLMENTA